MLRYSFNKSRCPRYKMSKIFLITLVVAMCMEHILAAPAPEEYKGKISLRSRVTPVTPIEYSVGTSRSYRNYP